MVWGFLQLLRWENLWIKTLHVEMETRSFDPESDQRWYRGFCFSRKWRATGFYSHRAANIRKLIHKLIRIDPDSWIIEITKLQWQACQPCRSRLGCNQAPNNLSISLINCLDEAGLLRQPVRLQSCCLSTQVHPACSSGVLVFTVKPHQCSLWVARAMWGGGGDSAVSRRNDATFLNVTTFIWKLLEVKFEV